MMNVLILKVLLETSTSKIWLTVAIHFNNNNNRSLSRVLGKACEDKNRVRMSSTVSHCQLGKYGGE